MSSERKKETLSFSHFNDTTDATLIVRQRSISDRKFATAATTAPTTTTAPSPPTTTTIRCH